METILFFVFIGIAALILVIVCWVKERIDLGWVMGEFKVYYDAIERLLKPSINSWPFIAHVFSDSFLWNQCRWCKQYYREQKNSSGMSKWVRELYERRTDSSFVEAYAMMAIIRGIDNRMEEIWQPYFKEPLVGNQALLILDGIEKEMRKRLMKKPTKYPSLQAHFYLDEDFFSKAPSQRPPSLQ